MMTTPLVELTVRSIEALADRVYSLGVSQIVAITPTDQADLVAASRALRRLLQSYERAAGRQLSTILLAGGV
jgi:hypothetical protein